jgi:hypothetical protein
MLFGAVGMMQGCPRVALERMGGKKEEREREREREKGVWLDRRGN